MRDKYEWGGVYVEDGGTSAWKTMFSTRGAGRVMMKTLKKGDVVIVTAVDRVSRRLRDLANVVHHLQEHGVNLIVLNVGGECINMSTLAGKSLLYALGWTGEIESEMRSDRSRQAHRQRKRKFGEDAVIMPRWGYRKTGNGTYAINEAFIPECQEIHHMVFKEGKTRERVRAILEERICKKKKRPFMNSAFHDWNIPYHYVRRALALYEKYLNEKSGS